MRPREPGFENADRAAAAGRRRRRPAVLAATVLVCGLLCPGGSVRAEAPAPSAEELALIRNEWREAGLFDPQHLALVRPYLGRHLKEGLIWKVPASVLKAVDEGGLENGSPDPFLDFLESECGNLATQEEEISCFNTWLSGLHGDVHYGVSVFEEGLLLFFGRKGTSLRLVGVFSGSG